jgi:hypothetical protein
MQEGATMSITSIHIASVVYDAARSSWSAIVEFFAPGLPVPLMIPVRIEGPLNVPHGRLVRALVREAEVRGIHP